MLKRKLCEARFEWTLGCPGPLLISDGRYESQAADERIKLPDRIFISRARPEAVLEAAKSGLEAVGSLPFYVPGSSLRGPFRSQAERIIRSVLPETAAPPATACDPFETRTASSQSCSRRLDRSSVEAPYAAVCPACKLFGCRHAAGRILFGDALIEKGCRSAYRDMIAIDRFTGGAYRGERGGKERRDALRLHVLENAAFTSVINLVNFELWQLGLMAYVLRDFEQGLVPIGFGKSKGLGLVTGKMGKILLTYPAGRSQGHIQHLGSLASEAEAERYGLHRWVAPEFGLVTEPAVGLGLYESFSVNEASMPEFWGTVAKAFNDFMEKRNKFTIDD